MNLTSTQAAALIKLGASMKYRSATDLGISGVTLVSLARLGLVEMKSHRVQSSNPRARVSNEPIERSYRASMKGFNLARKLNK